MSELRKAAEAVLEAWGWDWSEPRNEALRERMEALRQALAQPEEKMRIEGSGRITTKPYPEKYESEQEFKEAIRKASAQPNDFIYNEDGSYRLGPSTGSFGIGDAPEKKPEQEPVGYVTDSGTSAYFSLGVDLEDETPLYTAPPKREWVGLTVEEARKFYEKYTDREELIYAIDKFLEEKNGA